MHTRTSAMRSTLRFKVMFEAIIDEGRDASVSYEDNIATITAVTTIGTTLWYVSLAPE
jgi:hypothetical protein